MRLVIALFLSLLSLNAVSHRSEEEQSSKEDYKVGRYSSIMTKPTNAQMDLLAVIVEIYFPMSVDTVGSALDIMLINSGFRLADPSAVDPNLSILLNSPLPNIHRSLGPVSLRTALKTLSGSSWDLIIDPVHRLISFELINDYQLSFEHGEVASE
ncbi:MAG: pili assembly chaperone [Gammaproteobacteria bacterium]|jgi:type IV pili sensor histidine kinase/response regulator|nr:pili assembly chaperone [Gammaproteobacteria bacterium]MBT4193906.1 pili assembly chaperone [Gammaproteobacteria bacterium]MBT4449264.1 pili assembly chaperone [Gammaproteobacteria bacterium]MBT4859769.1 pili assembly chaperone [Gammaproteobacteria bacterium]MBT6455015.1 pili assembly chaperone [Gammaproteobacteria bacterium]